MPRRAPVFFGPMDLAEALLTLGLGESEERSGQTLKRAYLKQVRVHSPERDPQGFQRVREAYEWLQRRESALTLFQGGPTISVQATTREGLAREAPTHVTESAPPIAAFDRLRAALKAERPEAAAEIMLEIYAGDAGIC